ncbi:MAG TPA: inner membrane CreD family protein, partial [Chitinophagaceae bacterium]|nr:inner membrane CreD family protein [Chitinophagaceae bacterium]
MDNPNTFTSFWQKNRMIFKGLLIGFLVLLLLIPTVLIQELVEERQERQQEAITEVSSKWAGVQVISGPVIAVPYWVHSLSADGKPVKTRSKAYFLPERLNINAAVAPEKRYRGIYEIMVYTSDLRLTGNFSQVKFNELNIAPGDIIWQDAAIHLDVSDVRGLKEEVIFHFDGQQSELVPGKFPDEQFRQSLSGSIMLDSQLANTGFEF